MILSYRNVIFMLWSCGGGPQGSSGVKLREYDKGPGDKPVYPKKENKRRGGRTRSMYI